ncbi:hypothetical protein ACEWY4_009992 [Coilia grayii]|uniref:B box-type domain-containing protein n=1 Tax=Coilia grayii TaxID=363190 RepID=A0ABD1K805_9TELE
MSDPGDTSSGPVEGPHVGYGDGISDTAVKDRIKENVDASSHRAPSPVPSVVSMKSDQSMGEPVKFTGDLTPSTSNHDRPPSPESSVVSMKSDLSMKRPPDLGEESTQSTRAPNQLGLPLWVQYIAEVINQAVSYSSDHDRPPSPESSVVTMKSDLSMKRPPDLAEESTQSTSVPMDESRGVLCSACPERAFKSCLTCVASYCKNHVKLHYSAADLQRHKLVEATEDLEQRLCQQHYRELELFCKTDQTPVCSLCAAKHHSGHEITDLEEDELIKQGPPHCYLLPTEKSNIDGDEDVRKWTFGKRDSSKAVQTILVVGETGTGKTTLINTIVNYMLGVQLGDDVWFQITEENKTSQGQSQTTKITVYDVFVETSVLSLRIIDTPGYGSTDGLEFDQKVAEKLLVLFRSEDGVHDINAVGLVVKSGQNHLTDFQRYIFDAILSLFGKDIENNIAVFITHSDGMSVGNVITALNEIKVSTKDGSLKPLHFMFNNIQSESYKKEDEVLYQRAWDLGYRSMERFLGFLHNSSAKRLKMTKDVLNERKNLEARVHNLQDAIKMKELKQAELRETQKILEDNEKKLGNNEDFTYEIKEAFKEKVPIPSSRWWLTKEATCCTTCEENCHYPGCWWVKDLSKCSVMKDNRCTVCTGKCPVSAHVKVKWIYKPTAKKVEKNTADLKQQYTEQENIAKALEKEINESEVKKTDLLEEAYSCILELEKIALNKDSALLFYHREARYIPRTKMSSTSQKHKDFVAEPMGEKPVTALAGIGEVLGNRLEEKGFDKAYVVLGQFLVLKKDEELFRDWLKDTCGANAKQQGDCYGCLREWCDSFL